MSTQALRRRASGPRSPGPRADVRDLRRLRTAVRSGLRGVSGAPLVFALSVVTMAAGLLMLSAYLLVVMNVRAALVGYGEELSLVAFVASGRAAEPGAGGGLREAIAALEDVDTVDFVSREQALARLRRDLGADAGILDGLRANPLPASYQVAIAAQARSPAALRSLAARIEQLPGIDEVRWGEAWVESYARIVSGLEWIGAALGICMLLVLGVIVSGTVRLAVHARADEIQIQRLVGAGGFFVRLPFYVEAALQGALGAGLALGLLYGLWGLALPMLADTVPILLGGSPAFFSALQVAGLVALAVSLGVGAAVFSLAHLEEQP